MEKRFYINLDVYRLQPVTSCWNQLFSKNNIKQCRQQSLHILKNRGGFSDYKKIERESTSLWYAVFYYNTSIKTENQTAFGLQKLHLVYKTGFSITKTAFRLQISTCQLQTLRFGLQSGFSRYYWVPKGQLPYISSIEKLNSSDGKVRLEVSYANSATEVSLANTTLGPWPRRIYKI